MKAKEYCAQCNTPAEHHPVVGVMSVETASSTKVLSVLEIMTSNGTEWAAVPMCANCHKEPKIKAHFHYRQSYRMGLAAAGSSNL